MSWLFFEDVLGALGRKLSYDAIVNYAGNSFCEKAWDMISDANPLSAPKEKQGAGGGLIGLLNSGMVHIKGADKAK